VEVVQEIITKILEKSSTLSERLESKFPPNESIEINMLVDSQIDQWCQIVAQGNWEEFEKRLTWDNLDLHKVRGALGSVCMIDHQQLPAWAETLTECIQAATSVDWKTLKEGYFDNNSFLDPLIPMPFEEVLLPFIHVATTKLKNLAGSLYTFLSKDAHASLERSLLRWLSRLCSLSLELEFSIFRASRNSTITRFLNKSTNDYSKKYYQEFINSLLTGELLILFQEYPVLARLMAMTIDLWVDATQEFLSRLHSDQLEIPQIFSKGKKTGQVVAIKPGLSDRHNNGRSVMLVTFSSGLKLVYKPRNIEIEKVYINLLNWLNKHGIPLKFKLFKVLNRSTYGWVEFVPTMPCQDQEEAKRYYQRMGILLCLVHILEATDLHYQNVIACGEHPVLIDLETLMHHRVKKVQNKKTSRESNLGANQQIEHSVLRTGLLPYWQLIEEGQAYDVSALGAAAQENFVQVQKWININTDAMVVHYENVNIQPSQNAPSLGGVNLSLNDYHQEIIDGFQQMYQFMMEHRQEFLASDSPLAVLAHQELRFVFRATKTYGYLFFGTLNPNFLRNGIDWSLQFDILSRAMLLSNTKPLYWSLLGVEKQMLEQMDIPLFSTRADSDDLTIAPNQTIKNYFEQPSFNYVITRVRQLNYEDLEQQISWIRSSLDGEVLNDSFMNKKKQQEAGYNSIGEK
jgi:type 2 lantibiotic biosynthesis protein LanM